MAARIRFEECPYGCNASAKILDVDTGTMKDCPYCSSKRKTLMKEGVAIEDSTGQVEDLWKVLGIPQRYITDKFVYDSVIAEHERRWLEEESLERQQEEIEGIIDELLLNELPEYSLCIGLPIGGRVENVIYPILATAYKNGFSIAKCISSAQYGRMVLKQSDELEDYFTKDIVVILINEGASYGDISMVKGLLQTRGLSGLPTILVTTWKIEACSALLSSVSDDKSLFLAYPAFVSYVSSGRNHSSYINGLLGVDNGVYTESEEAVGGTSISDL